MKSSTAVMACYAVGLAMGLVIGYGVFSCDREPREPDRIKAQMEAISICVDWWTKAGTYIELAVPRCEGMVARLDSFKTDTPATTLTARSQALWACVDGMAASGKKDFESKVVTCEHIVRRVGK